MYSAIDTNKRNTVIIIGLFLLVVGGVCVWACFSFENPTFPLLCLAFVITYTIVQYFSAAKWTMASAGGIEIQKSDNPRLFRIVENLAITEGLPMPRVFIIPDESPNALAAGRDPEHAFVAATSGLLELMDDKELQGVFAHEMSHVKNLDIRVKTLVFGLIAGIAVLAQLSWVMAIALGSTASRNLRNGVGLIVGMVALAALFVAATTGVVAFVVGPLIRAGVSRQREYLADITGVEITRYPEGLISALEKIQAYDHKPVRPTSSATAQMFFSDPKRVGLQERWLGSHPPIAKRIERLKANANQL